MKGHYPAGSNHDNAPWNRPDLPDEKCKHCKDGYNYVMEDENDITCHIEKEQCEFCEGTGIKQ